jgi:hypothetical protein
MVEVGVTRLGGDIMLLGFEPDSFYMIHVTEDIFRWAPSGHCFSLQHGYLRVLRTDNTYCAMDFMSDDRQPFNFTRDHVEIEQEGPWQTVQGDGVAILLGEYGPGAKLSQRIRNTRFVGFVNRSTNQFLESPHPTWGLKTLRTDQFVERKGLLGAKRIPFTHNDDTLRKLVSDVIELGFKKYFGIFGERYEAYLAENESGHSGRLQ